MDFSLLVPQKLSVESSINDEKSTFSVGSLKFIFLGILLQILLDNYVKIAFRFFFDNYVKKVGSIVLFIAS